MPANKIRATRVLHPPLFSNLNDIPVIIDVNRDGDFDILTYDQFGSTIGYYENQHSENPGNPSYASGFISM